MFAVFSLLLLSLLPLFQANQQQALQASNLEDAPVHGNGLLVRQRKEAEKRQHQKNIANEVKLKDRQKESNNNGRSKATKKTRRQKKLKHNKSSKGYKAQEKNSEKNTMNLENHTRNKNNKKTKKTKKTIKDRKSKSRPSQNGGRKRKSKKNNLRGGKTLGKKKRGKTENNESTKNRDKKYRKKEKKIKHLEGKNVMKKRKSKANKCKRNRRESRGILPGLRPSDPNDPSFHDQIYDCDFYRLTKAQSVSRTQLNRAKRVKSKVKQLQGYSLSAATQFTRIFENMQLATNNGKTCKGQNLTTEEVEIFNTLKNCSVSVPVACNIANIDIDPEFETFQIESDTMTTCIPLLDKYGTDYKEVLFNFSNSDPANVCRNLSQPNLINPAAKPQVDTLLLPNQCLPQTFKKMDKSATKILRQCLNATLLGSHGNCTAAAFAAHEYTIPCTSSLTTGAPSGRRGRLQKHFESFMLKQK